MQDKTLTTKAIRLRLQAARALERSLPNLVREAYGVVPEARVARTAEEQNLAEISNASRASLIDNDRLTREELDSLPVEDAVSVALLRLREQISALEEEQAAHKSRPDSFGRAPRTLRR